MLVLRAMESMSKELSESKAQNGKLKDEINRLNGEKGRPEFKRKEKGASGDKVYEIGEKADKRTNHKTGTTKACLYRPPRANRWTRRCSGVCSTYLEPLLVLVFSFGSS